jgi:hypothetical protein
VVTGGKRWAAHDGVAPEIHDTYALGYIVAGPSRGLVSQAGCK